MNSLVKNSSVHHRRFWYIACESKDLGKQPIARTILNEWVVLYRDEKGRAVAFQDRCIHRNFQLSKGKVKNGCLECPYHGWTFNSEGTVVRIPSEGPENKVLSSRKAISYDTIEQDDFIYVRLEKNSNYDASPFAMPHYKEKGFKTVRLFNVFKNNVTNCAENYIDVPHTVFVHDGIFRSSENKKFKAIVERVGPTVKIDYRNETTNVGWFSWFLNPSGGEITHHDYFHAPNVTSVEYYFGKKEFFITSHSVPVSDTETHVYTDLTFEFGFWNLFASPIVRYQGQSVIDQDIEVLDNQMKVIQKYGSDFSNSKADIIHVLIESIRDEVAAGGDPRELPNKSHEIEFWI